MAVAILVVGIILGGCSSSNTPPTGYYSNSPQGGQPQGGQYVGGGCGLAASQVPAPTITGASAEA